jgi:citrate synthase
MSDAKQLAQDWWTTDIIDMRPNEIRFHGYPIEQLIGNVSFPAMIWLMLRGELPSEQQAALLGAALVAGVDHGPQAPSIAIARMAITCGVGLNNAMASAINTLGDIHGGAGEQAVELYNEIKRLVQSGTAFNDAVHQCVEQLVVQRKFIPGFGHRFHQIDPRAPRLLALVEAARQAGVVSGNFVPIARAIEQELAVRKGKLVPMNIDGATAVIFAELGFDASLARGLFVLSRSVGILAHAWEQKQQGGRNKGPIPPQFLYTYSGTAPRDLS